MTFRLVGATVAAVLAAASLAGAQPSEDGGRPPAPAGQAAQTPPVAVEQLPIDLNRIRRKLAEGSREEQQGLRFTVDVFAQAPPLVLFTPQDNLRFGPSPYGAPTHRDLMNIVTPQYFQLPAMDLNSLARWLAEQRRRSEERR